MKQSKSNTNGKSKGRKEFDNFDENRKSLNTKFSEKKSSKNWKNNLFNDDKESDDDFLFDEEE